MSMYYLLLITFSQKVSKYLKKIQAHCTKVKTTEDENNDHH